MPPKKNRAADVDTGNDATTSDFNIVMQEILATVRSNGEKLNTNTQKLNNLEKKYEVLSEKQAVMDKRLTVVESNYNGLLDIFNNHQQTARNMEISSIRNEENSRRFNAILYNIPEDSGLHESRKTSVEKVQEVLEGLHININDINIVEAHRLPTKSGEGRKPLIFKLSSMSHKDVIWDHLCHLKSYNESNAKGDKVRINMTHLPSKLAKDTDDLRYIYEDEKSRK